MNRLVLGILLLLTACAASGPQAVKLDPAQLQAQLERLPGARVSSLEPLRFSYPDQTMFGAGAVLPLPGGTALLDPLADFIRRNPSLDWRVDLQVETAYGTAYDQNLAEKRSELLATYLLSKGASLQKLHFHPEAAAGPPLIFTLTPPQKAVE